MFCFFFMEPLMSHDLESVEPWRLKFMLWHRSLASTITVGKREEKKKGKGERETTGPEPVG